MWYTSKRFVLTAASIALLVADAAWLHLLGAEAKAALVAVVVGYLISETARPSSPS